MDHHHNQVKIFPFMELIPSLDTQLPQPLQPQATTDLLSVTIVLPFLEFHMSEIIQNIILWLFTWDSVLKFTQVVVYQYFILFLLIIRIPYYGYITTCLFINWLMDNWIVSFEAFTNNVATNIHIQVFVINMFPFLLG